MEALQRSLDDMDHDVAQELSARVEALRAAEPASLGEALLQLARSLETRQGEAAARRACKAAMRGWQGYVTTHGGTIAACGKNPFGVRLAPPRTLARALTRVSKLTAPER